MQIQLRWARYQSPASPRALPRPTNRSVSRGGGRERGARGSKRKHPIEPTFSHSFDLRSHRGTIRCLGSSVAPRCRDLPARLRDLVHVRRRMSMGEGELASAFRLRSSVRKRSRWSLPALTWKHPRIPSARSMAPPNVNVGRLDLSLLRPAILLTPPHPPLLPDVGHGLRG